MSEKKPLILQTNDDGIEAAGLRAMANELASIGRVVTVAPRHEQSASGHSLTLRQGIRVDEIGVDSYVVWGTPSDCVLLAIEGLLDEQPDVLVSGINHGPNMGEDVTYSGTVAAAIEGTILDVPSMAISSLQRTMKDAQEIARVAASIVRTVMAKGIPAQTLLNVNIPDPEKSPIRGVKITKLGSRAYRNILRPEKRTGGSMHYAIKGEKPVWKEDNGTDIAAVRSGHVSITPLHLDLTDYKSIVEMERWNFEI